MTKEELNALSENGKKWVKQITLKFRGEKLKGVFVMDFNLFRKATNAAIAGQIEQNKGKGSNTVNLSFDGFAAGDKILFHGWHSGDDTLKENAALRAKCVGILGEWLQEITEEMDAIEIDEEDEKKS